MKHSKLLACAFSLFLLAVNNQAAGLGTAFTYQGRLTDGGNPANGPYEMSFSLYDAVTNGDLVATPVTVTPVTVSNGLFTATLDFGPSAFNGEARWVEIGVRTNSSGEPIRLSPRQLLTPTPYALHAANAGGLISFANVPLEIRAAGFRALRIEGNVTSPNMIAGSGGNYVAPGVVGAVISGGGSLDYQGIPYTNSVTGDFGAIGGGLLNASSGKVATIAGGYGNNSGGYAASVGGGFGNSSGGFAATAAGGVNNGAFGSYATVGGGSENRSSGSYSTVSGGYQNSSPGHSASVVGGQRNQSYGDNSAIVGGSSNTNVERFGFIGGGSENTTADGFGTIAGGYKNRSMGYGATIGGGEQNVCVGPYAVVVGGFLNSAGDYGFAAGYRAKANHRGSFVWADPQPFDFPSANSGEFSARATGGVRFVSAVDTNGAPVAGVSLPAGSGSWTSLSDRNAKADFKPLNPRDILERVARLPVQSWRYKTEADSIRHIGPVAQDFAAAFNVGVDDKHIATVDANGVALAAIQGLNTKLEEKLKTKDAEIQSLRKDLASLQQFVNDLANRKGAEGP